MLFALKSFALKKDIVISLLFFFKFVLHLTQFDCSYLTLAKVPLLSLSLNSGCVMLSFCYHLASFIIFYHLLSSLLLLSSREFWIKCHYCFVYALSLMLYSRKKERFTKKIHCKCLCTRKGKNSKYLV